MANGDSVNEVSNIIDQTRALVRKARQKEAYALTAKALKKYPENISLQVNLAVLIGDNEEGVSKAKRAQNHKTAAKMLKVLLKRMRGLDLSARTRLRNEYYWFSHQPLKQYRLGVEMVRKGLKRSFYSQGVGAVMVATQYAEQGKVAIAIRWGQKAEAAWKKYFKINPGYYNAYCWYARSLGLQGNFEEMEQALKKAAALSKRPLKFYEFQDVRDDIYKLVLKIKK